MPSRKLSSNMNCHPERSASQFHREERSRRPASSSRAALARHFLLERSSPCHSTPKSGVAVTVNQAAHRVDITIDGAALHLVPLGQQSAQADPLSAYLP